MSETDAQGGKPKIPKLGIRKIVTVVIVVLLILAILWPVSVNLREFSRRTRCAQHLHQLGICMLVYDGGDGEVRPTAEKWCDLLVKYLEVKPEEFVCRGADVKIGESSYAMNEDVADKTNSQISPDVVSLFETNFGRDRAGREELLQNREWYKAFGPEGHYRPKWVKEYRASEKVYKLRWNQVGGPELVTFENHKGQGCNVVFHDLHIEFVKPEQLGELNWEDK